MAGQNPLANLLDQVMDEVAKRQALVEYSEQTTTTILGIMRKEGLTLDAAIQHVQHAHDRLPFLTDLTDDMIGNLDGAVQAFEAGIKRARAVVAQARRLVYVADHGSTDPHLLSDDELRAEINEAKRLVAAEEAGE